MWSITEWDDLWGNAKSTYMYVLISDSKQKRGRFPAKGLANTLLKTTRDKSMDKQQILVRQGITS